MFRLILPVAKVPWLFLEVQYMKIMKIRGPWGHDGFLSINIYFQYFFQELHARSLLGLCVPGVTEGPKGHLEDHLERSLRPIQATQMTPGHFWTREKHLGSMEPFELQIQICRLKHYFPLKKPLKRLCAGKCI